MAKDKDNEYRVHTIIVTPKDDMFAYFSDFLYKSNNLYNATNFHIRQVYTAVNCDGTLHPLQQEVMDGIKNAIDGMNVTQIKAFEKAKEKRFAKYQLDLETFYEKLNNYKSNDKYKDLNEDEIIKKTRLKRPEEPTPNLFEMPSKEQSFLSYNFLEAYFKHVKNVDYKALPSQANQAVMKKLYTNWDSFFKQLADYQINPHKYKGKPRIPNYKPSGGMHELGFTNQICKLKFDEETNTTYIRFPKTKLNLSLGQYLKQDTMKLQEVRVQKFYNNIKVELVEDVTHEVVPMKTDFNVFMGIDLGVSNYATCVTTNGAKPLIVNGNPLKASNEYYNILRSRYYGELRQGYSENQGTFTSHRLECIDAKRNLMNKDYTHKASNIIVGYALENNVDKVFIGKNKGWKDNLSLKLQEKKDFKFLGFEMLIKQIIYKLKKFGIPVEVCEESYTSKASAVDQDEIPTFTANNNKNYCFSGKRVSRGLYRTKDGILINADVNGAYNIIRKHCGKVIKLDIKTLLNPVKLTPKRAKKKSQLRREAKNRDKEPPYINKKKEMKELIYSKATKVA